MRAIGFHEYGTPDVLQVLDLPLPEPGPGEVRIRVHAAAVSPTDAAFRAGDYAPRVVEAGVEPPFIPGMDAAGVVDAVGPDGDGRLAVGDRVVAFVRPVSPWGGAYADFIVLPSASVVAAPAGVDHVAASTFLMNALTARVSLDALALDPGDPLVVTGAPGLLGGYLIQLAKADGLTVIADAAPADEDLVRSFGADHVVPRGDGFVPAVRALLPDGTRGLVDAGILNDRALGAVADGGAMVVLQGWDGPVERDIVLHRIFVAGWAEDTARMETLVDQVEAGVLGLRVLDVLPAERAAEAHARMHAGGIRGRIVLDFS
jgi:NADPH:quinone reductase-like Zn-dependent oxidoreductase